MQTPQEENRNSGHFQVVSLRAATLESASVVGGRLYHPHRATALRSGESPTFSVEALVSSSLTIGFMKYSGGVHIKTPQLDDSYHVNIPLDWSLRTASGDEFELIPPRSAAVYQRGRPATIQGWDTDGRVLALKIARGVLEQRAADMFGHSVRDVSFDLHLPLDTPRGREWLTLLKLLTNGMSPGDSLMQNPMLSVALQDSVVSGLLLLPTNSARPDHGGASDPVIANVLDLALAYMDRHADQPITMSSLASHLGVSVRSVQGAFRAELDTTPHEHLRAVRLERAHQELVLATPQEASVTQIARRWGFGNMGRFAAHYTQVYGETPKATLRNPA
ncbi:AraC family transcriptional regulator [Paenarthrobacter nicotinovorans]|uniref:AraC family transcriptional regulator n=1 Tax=Paenarthrobacter nicotinovorans TaxID=29320 RepID=UPI0004787CE0|nr:AraC family transcriptional regulator [Paenarthrobacter nicotinovorans]